MPNITNLTTDDLKKIIKESVRETLSDKKLKNIFHEVIEDISLAKVIDQGMESESIDKKAFQKKLKSKIQ